MGGRMHGQDGMMRLRRSCKAHCAATPVYDACYSGNRSSQCLDDRQHFLNGTSGRHDILTDKYALTGTDIKSSAELHGSVFPLRKKRPYSELAPHLLSDHNPTEGRGDHNIDGERPETKGNISTQGLASLRILEYFCALKILIAVQTGGQLEMPFQQSAGFPEHRQHLVRVHGGIPEVRRYG
jgi:hypothetical protein